MRRAPFLAALLAACGPGQEEIAVRGDFARPADAPERVYALEARVDAEVREGAFRVEGLATSPISLRLVQAGDTVARIDLADLPPGASLAMHGLRIDARTRRAFPATVDLSGASTVSINGIRMGTLPATVNAGGVVLAASRDGSALLVRPTDPDLPDLRVVTSPATAAATRGGAAASLSALSVGDSVRVEGETERGFVVADRVVVGAP